ncbi:mitochondrial carrier domain-containing protein [Hyaloraphidium curvatum]|nr:mitochondrial carrier domain-containing protein [Hyaloraphidium curvatum]
MAPAEDEAPRKGALSESTKSLIAGGAGGLGLTLAGYPFDLVKVKMQTAPASTYSGMLNCAAKILRADGPLGFYRGATPVFLGVVPIFATLFWAYDRAQHLAVRLWGGEKRVDVGPAAAKAPLVDRLSLDQIAFAGGLSAVPTTILMGPAERVKILLQIQEKGSTKYSGAVSAVLGLLKQGGLPLLFRGTWMTLLRDSWGSIFYFGIFEAAKRAFQRRNGGGELGAGVVVCGALAGAANWIVIMPIDVAKSKAQAVTGPSRGMIPILRDVYRTEGIRGLFAGLGPALVRAVPANAAAFTCVESTRHFLDRF